MKNVVVIGSFKNIKSRDVRFLHEASKLGKLIVLLWSDELIEQLEGKRPEFSQAERQYFIESIRYVNQVIKIDHMYSSDEIPPKLGTNPDIWAVTKNDYNLEKQSFCANRGIQLSVIKESDLKYFPIFPFNQETNSSKDKVIVSGSFDWLHTGHIRFFEETSELGDLYVVVGHDQNLQLLKGADHPMFPENERLYMVQSIRYVRQALISTGHGWMDAKPEINLINPDLYVVNEDGDVPEKREFCQERNLQYKVLKRRPKPGLTARQSTALRGF
ncbi:MAG: adenylyltransferase/cytidyltransferase family protein [Anaerolineaceae bacterium]